MQPETVGTGETSGVFWWWRAPNDSLRTGERSELEAALKSGGLTSHCFVWRSDWGGWLQAAEVPQLQDVVPTSLRMPAVLPALTEPASEPPPLPALYEVLCEAAKPNSEVTHTALDPTPWFKKWNDDEITSCQKLDPEPPSMPVSEPPSSVDHETPRREIDEIYERVCRAVRAHVPRLPFDWQSRVIQVSVFAACALALSGFAAMNAVVLNHAFAAGSRSLVVTVAGPSQTFVPDAAVVVDGEIQCPRAPCQVELGRGIHLVSITAPGFAPTAAKAVAVERDQILHFDLIQPSERVAVAESRPQDP
jgi:GYF domain 2